MWKYKRMLYRFRRVCCSLGNFLALLRAQGLGPRLPAALPKILRGLVFPFVSVISAHLVGGMLLAVRRFGHGRVWYGFGLLTA